VGSNKKPGLIVKIVRQTLLPYSNMAFHERKKAEYLFMVWGLIIGLVWASLGLSVLTHSLKFWTVITFFVVNLVCVPVLFLLRNGKLQAAANVLFALGVLRCIRAMLEGTDASFFLLLAFCFLAVSVIRIYDYQKVLSLIIFPVMAVARVVWLLQAANEQNFWALARDNGLALFIFVAFMIMSHFLVKVLAHEVELTLELEAANKELLGYASTDKLTGAYNRRKFDELAGCEMERLNRYGIPFSVLYLDLDNFKHLNDTKGHTIGDSVLSGVARLIAANLRQTDSLFRWGGDEFVILCANAHLHDAEVIGEKILQLVASGKIEDSHPIGVSIGAVEVRAGECIQEALARADKLLYKAKLEGRRRLCV